MGRGGGQGEAKNCVARRIVGSPQASSVRFNNGPADRQSHARAVSPHASHPHLSSVEISGALFELSEILHRTQAALRTKNLLLEDPAQPYRVEPEASLFRTIVRIHVELTGRVKVYAAIQAGEAQARVVMDLIAPSYL
jgi:hypothetical protein